MQGSEVRCSIAGHRRKGSSFLSFFSPNSAPVCLFDMFFQNNSDRAAGEEGRDSESGHLTYRSGDLLQERCRFTSAAAVYSDGWALTSAPSASQMRSWTL